MTADLFAAGSEELLRELPGSSHFAAYRQAQLAAFQAAGLPSVRLEDWRYTNLARISAGGFIQPEPRTEPDPGVGQLVAAATLGLEDAYRLAFVDGFFAPSLSTLPTEDGVVVSTLQQRLVAGEDPPPFKLHGDGSALAALNAAWLRDGAAISVQPDVDVSRPIYIVFLACAGEKLAVQPRVLLDIGSGAQLTVVQHYAAAAEAQSWLNTVLEASLANACKLTLLTLQEHAARQTHTSTSRMVLERDASLILGGADFGGGLVRHDIQLELVGPGAGVDMFGLFFPGAGQHMDIHTRIDHLAPDTTSDASYRGIVAEGGRGVFNGKVVVHPDAQRIDARQSSDNLLLGERCEIDTKPELEIYADDVKCSHGATVGELDHDALFYLLSRGLPEANARALLTYAFANEVVARLPLEPLRRHVARRILGAMPEAGLDQDLDEVLG